MNAHDRHLERCRAYRLANRDKIRAAQKIRRSRKYIRCAPDRDRRTRESVRQAILASLGRVYVSDFGSMSLKPDYSIRIHA